MKYKRLRHPGIFRQDALRQGAYDSAAFLAGSKSGTAHQNGVVFCMIANRLSLAADESSGRRFCRFHDFYQWLR